MDLQLKPLDRVKWCFCMGNRTAAMIVAGVELAWLVALAIVVVWRWAIENRDDDQQLIAAASVSANGGDGTDRNLPRMTPAQADEYIDWVKSWFRAITAVMFAAFVAGLISNICLIIGLKQLNVKLITIWLVVSAFLMLLVILFLLLPLVFGGRPTYSAFLEFLVDAWFFLIVLSAREDTKLAVFESAQMRYDPSSNGAAVAGVPQTPTPHDVRTQNNMTDTYSANNTWPNSTQQNEYDEIAGIESNHNHRDIAAQQFHSNLTNDVESQRNSTYSGGDRNLYSSQFNVNDDVDLGRQQQFPHNNYRNGTGGATSSTGRGAAAAAAPSYPIGAVPPPAGSANAPIDIVRRLKARFTRRG